MEKTCTRCQQPVPEESCFCPSCGLPQLVYSSEGEMEQVPQERWVGAIRDASAVNWKSAIRSAIAFAVPAGLITSGISPLHSLGLLWMAGFAAWAVTAYVRKQGAPWITSGAGARIGLITGLMAAWLAFTVTGGAVFAQRYYFHRATQMDAAWATTVQQSQQLTKEWMKDMGAQGDAEVKAYSDRNQHWMMSPWGRAGIQVFSFVSYGAFLVFFAIGGGVVGARLAARARRPRV